MGALAGLAARLVVGLDGPELRPDEEAWLRRWRPAGVILFSRNVLDARQLAALCGRLRAVLGPGGDIVADHEGGPVSVLAAALGRPPAAWGLGRLDDPDLTRRVHAAAGAAARAAGLTRLLAPCADVLVEPRNPVIGARAFGPSPSLVARHVAAAVRGLREGGVGVCLKHWPGHGGTAGDSHDGPVEGGGGDLAAPFAAGLAAGADAVMLGHLPAGDPERPRRPATLSPAAARRARDLAVAAGAGSAPPRLFADDVTMGALRPFLGGAPGSPPAGSAGGLLAPGDLDRAWLEGVAAGGCDLLLCRGIPWTALPAAAVPRPGPAAGREPASPAPGSGPPPGGEFADGAPEPPGPEPYAEARRRLAAVGPAPLFGAARGPLLWLDATAGDRWGPAAGLEALLEVRFDPVVRIGPGAEAGAAPTPPGAPVGALLVTSHRPLPPSPLAGLASRLAPAGACLVMGHPSLSADLAAVLPGRWRLLALPDLRPADLAPVLAEPPVAS